MDLRKILWELIAICCPEKPERGVYQVTVPQTDTGRRAEYAKARELTPVKELGKMAP